MMLAMRTALVGCCAVLLSLTSGLGYSQEKKIMLRVADSFPVGHYFVENGAKHFMEAVKRATNGQVGFEHYPAEQLGKAKDMLGLIVTEVADIGSLVPSYHSDKMPLSEVTELPGNFTSSCDGTLAYWKLARDGLLAQKEFGSNGIRILFTLVTPPYQLMMKRKMVSIKDIEGQKLRTLGASMDGTVRRLNAVPVRMAAQETYESLSRGTLDGVVFPLSSALAYNLHTVVKFVTVGENFGASTMNYSISEARWKNLPENVQKAMLEAGEGATRSACEYADRAFDTDTDKFKQKGVTFVRLSDADRRQLQSMSGSVAREWANALDKRGKPGTEVLKAFLLTLQSVRQGRP